MNGPTFTQLPQVQKSYWQVGIDYLSSIDWKTHALIVLSYALIAFGLALACSSFYIAFVAHPMVAVTSPIFPIFAGIFLRHYVNNENKPGEKPKVIDHLEPPRGINRPQAVMNCWIISALQLMFHIPSFKKMLEHASLEEKQALAPLYAEWNNYRNGREVNHQAIRNWFSLLNAKDTEKSAQGKDDASGALAKIFNINMIQRSSFPETFMQRKFIADRDPRITKDYPINEYNLGYQTTLELHFFDQERSIQKAINTLFHNSSSVTGVNVGSNERPQYEDGKNTTWIFLPTPPEDLSFLISGDSIYSAVNNEYIPIPPAPFKGGMAISLSAEQVGQNAVYACDGFIAYQSEHYIAFFLDKGKWWQANDDVVKECSVQDIKNLQETGLILNKKGEWEQWHVTFIHYTKVC